MKPIYFNEVNSVLQKSPEYDEVKHGKLLSNSLKLGEKYYEKKIHDHIK